MGVLKGINMSIFTNLSQEKITNLLQSYDLGTLLSFSGIEGGTQNTNYLIKTQQGQFVLTLLETASFKSDKIL